MSAACHAWSLSRRSHPHDHLPIFTGGVVMLVLVLLGRKTMGMQGWSCRASQLLPCSGSLAHVACCGTIVQSFSFRVPPLPHRTPTNPAVSSGERGCDHELLVSVFQTCEHAVLAATDDCSDEAACRAALELARGVVLGMLDHRRLGEVILLLLWLTLRVSTRSYRVSTTSCVDSVRRAVFCYHLVESPGLHEPPA